MKLIALLLCISTMAAYAAVEGEAVKSEALKTTTGINFRILGRKPDSPAPTLFIFATTAQDSLETDDYCKIGRILAGRGFLSVSLDLPCHGEDAIPGETNALAGWRIRIEKGDDIVNKFMTKASSVLDYLIANGYTDPAKVAACGTSRGGFMAMHFAAAEPRIRSCAAFAPVTDLNALGEFQGMKDNALTQSLMLSRHVDKLTDRAVWLCIGNNDQRVDTDSAIQFSRKLVKACIEHNMPARVDLHVVNGQPHRLGHAVYTNAHDDAADWIAAQIGDKK